MLDAIVRYPPLPPPPRGRESNRTRTVLPVVPFRFREKIHSRNFCGIFYVIEAIKTWQEILCCFRIGSSLGVKKIHATHPTRAEINGNLG